MFVFCTMLMGRGLVVQSPAPASISRGNAQIQLAVMSLQPTFCMLSKPLHPFSPTACSLSFSDGRTNALAPAFFLLVSRRKVLRLYINHPTHPKKQKTHHYTIKQTIERYCPDDTIKRAQLYLSSTCAPKKLPPANPFLLLNVYKLSTILSLYLSVTVP